MQGASAVINCTTDLAVTTIVWLDEGMRVLNNASESPLILFLAETTETQQYTCIITSPFGNQSQSIRVSVAQLESSPSSAVVGGTIVAAILFLLLIAAGVIIIVNVVIRLVFCFVISISSFTQCLLIL
jgi:hypothetical protein